jgi:hypothetical protein
MNLSRMVGNKERSGTVNFQDTSVFLFILFFSFKIPPRDLIFLKFQTTTLEFLNEESCCRVDSHEFLILQVNTELFLHDFFQIYTF